jgi:hypothetical protein
MEHERPRWRVRIRTVMLLVVIAALGVALYVEHQRRIVAEQRAQADAARALAEAQAVAEQVRAQVVQAEARLRKELDDAKKSRPRGE